MGLDLVEYVLAIEDAFEIAIPDADAARLTTPAELIDYLCQRFPVSSDGPPLVQTVFYRLRTAIAEELGIARRQIHPASVLTDLTGRPEREVWAAVAVRLNLKTKDLTHAPVAKFIAKLTRAPMRSIGELAEQLAMMHPAAMKPAATGWTRAQVTEVALRLLEYEIAVDVRPMGLDVTFVRDLGMG